jgi:hypothetical protein
VTQLACSGCGAVLDFGAERTRTCPYCLASAVLERPASPDRPNPTFTLGFTVEREAARSAVRSWARSRSVFTHGGLQRAALDDVRGVYLPAYVYSALSRASFTAVIGEDYTETETYTETDSDGKTVTRTRTVTRTEHRPLEGEHVAYVTDVLVTASRTVGNDELQAVEPFDLRALRRYTPALVAGWITEEPSRSRDESLELARREATEETGRKLARFMPGDSYADLRFATTIDRESLDLLLVPLWVFALKYAPDEPAARVFVNGQTLAVGGHAPRSTVRILVAVALGLLLIGGLVALIVLSAGRR